jgi:hypothetical protein
MVTSTARKIRDDMLLPHSKKAFSPTNTAFNGRMVERRQAWGIAGSLQPLQALQAGAFVAVK